MPSPSDLNQLTEGERDTASTPGWVRWTLFSLDFVTKIGLLIAVVYGVFEYNGAVHDKQRELSFKMIENWEEDGFRRNFQIIASEIDGIRETLPEAYTKSPHRSHLETTYVAKELLQRIDTDPRLRASVQDLYYFYSKVGICAIGEICDGDLLSAFFTGGAQDFLSYLHPFAIRARNSGQPEFGTYAETFFLD